MRTTIALLTIIFFSACSRSGNKLTTDCEAQMIARFKDQVTCTEIPTYGPCYVLEKGIYKGEKIYFINIACIACDAVAPKEGYNCDGQKIAIENFNQNVTGVASVHPRRKD